MINDTTLQKVLQASLETGGDFAEIFVENKVANGISVINNEVLHSNGGIDFGVGIRIIDKYSAIYAYTNDCTEENLIKIAKEASYAIKNNKNIDVLNFVKTKVISKHNIKIMPDPYSKKRASEELKMASREMFKQKDITETNLSYTDYVQDILIANSDGLFITDQRVRSRFSINAVASKGNEKHKGYFSYGGYCGLEIFDNYDLKELAEKSSELAINTLNAKKCPSGKMPVVIENGFGGVIFHEACGHSLEATAVAKGTSEFKGKMGEKIASDKVTAVDDGTLKNQWGSINIDDEGEKSQKNVLIENGILKSYLVDKLNGKKMNAESTGSSRRQSYKYAPTSRMTNTYIDKGTDNKDDIISSVDYGLYAKKMGGGSVQPATGEFNFAVLEGYIIRNGKICEQVKGATLIGKGGKVLQDIDMVADNLEMAVGMCGSISGSVPTNVGQPRIRVKQLTVGGMA